MPDIAPDKTSKFRAGPISAVPSLYQSLWQDMGITFRWEKATM
jgi:hypothetical protein